MRLLPRLTAALGAQKRVGKPFKRTLNSVANVCA
jgi:hypothetical protein